MTILFPGVQQATEPSTTIKNSSAAALAVPSTPQTIGTTAITYLTGSKIAVPNGGLTLGALYSADLDVLKAGAGTETAVINLLAGPNGDATDTVIAILNKPAGAGAGEALVSVRNRIVGQYATSQVPYLSNSSLGVINNQSTQGVVALSAYATHELATLSTTQVAALAVAKYVGLALTISALGTYQVVALDAQLSGLTTGNAA